MGVLNGLPTDTWRTKWAFSFAFFDRVKQVKQGIDALGHAFDHEIA